MTFRKLCVFVISGLASLVLLGRCTLDAILPIPTQPIPIESGYTPVPSTAVRPTALLTTSTLASTSDPHIAGADCKSCHPQEHKRWPTTLHTANIEAVLANETHNKTELLSDECLFCHAPFQAGEYNVSYFVGPIDQAGPWEINLENAYKWEGIKCESCHKPTSTSPLKLAFFDAMEGDYVPVKNSMELCAKCHKPGTDDGHNLKGSVHEGVQCVTCHLLKGTEMSLDPSQSCSQCHPRVNPKHPDVTKLDTTLVSSDSKNDIHFVTCKNCHPNGLPASKP